MNINQLNGATKRVGPIVFVLTLIAVLAVSLFRVMIGGGPLVFADEFTYAAQAKALWFDQAAPSLGAAPGNWLYLLITSPSFAFHADYLSLSRTWNVLSIVLAGSVLFLVFRRFAEDIVAAVASCASVALFGAGYARLFMPEAMQFSMVALAACAFQYYGRRPHVTTAVLLGALLGAGGLIKVHVFLLIPCFLVGIAMICYVRRMPWSQGIGHAFVCLVSALLLAYVTRLAISGKSDFNLFGEFYSGVAHQVGSDWTGISRYGYVLTRHIETLLLAFSPAVALAIFALIGLRRNGDDMNIVRCTMLVLAMGILGMMLVTAMFTANVAGTGPYESLDRLHGRYYEHMVIILATLASMHATTLIQGVGSRLRFVVLLGTATCAIACFFASKRIGWQNPIDFVSVFGLYGTPHARSSVLVLGLLALAICLIRPALARVASVLALALVLTFSTVELDKVFVNQDRPGAERAAMLVADTGDHAPVVVASSSANADLFRAGFYLLKQNAALVVVPEQQDEATSCPREALTAGWLLAVSPAKSIRCDGFEKFTEFEGAIVYRRHG